ncbi:ribosomal-processing cysteine protease Prp [Fructilactobacillus vespulae]|uniref:ribosomal-processing cysteine protease Prp n=1 Tax=Fructilactobacillus vespulae TaxID=1249630 RepID=UPI0039B5C2CF
MIKAKFNSSDNLITGFSLTGHADSDEYGHDIVCAAASVLVITTVNNLSRVAGIDPVVHQDEKNGGYIKVSVNDADVNNVKVQTLLLSLQNGIIDLSNEYSDFVKLK